MNRIHFHTVFVYFFSFLLFLFSATAAYLQKPFLVFIPPALVLLILLVQHPHWLFYVLLASVPWSVEYNFNQALATDLPDEPLMLVTAFTAITIFIYKKNNRPQNVHPIIFLLGLQLAWVAITVVSSSDVLLSTKYLLAKSWYLMAFVAMPLFIFKEKKMISRAAIVLAVSMLLLMLVSLVRHGSYNWTFENVNTSLTPFFRNHVTYSALLVCMVPLQIAFIRLTRVKLLRFFLITVLLVSIAAVYLSFARGAWLALLTGSITYWLLKKKLLVYSFFFFIVACLGTIYWLQSNDRYLQFALDYKSTIFHTNFKEHLVATYRMKDLSTAERYYRWIAGVRMTKDNWRTGFGPNTFYNNYKSYAIPAFETWVSQNKEHSTVHNYFLLLLIEQGVIGLMLFLALICALFWYAQKIYHRTQDRFWKTTSVTVASILTMICTVNFLSDLVETDKVGSVFYLCIGVLIVTDFHTRTSVTGSHVPNQESTGN